MRPLPFDLRSTGVLTQRSDGAARRGTQGGRWASRVELGSVAESTPESLCALPVLGETTVEDAVLYGAVGTLAVFGLVSWPTAALIGSAHALHQRARNVIRTGVVQDARNGLLDVVDETL
jgi:hypothetical protein